MTTNIVNVFEPAQFGIGDGATTQFQIGGPRETLTSITPTGVWRQDWQGNQRLYPTPRTNLQANSEVVGGFGWQLARTSGSTGARIGPDGALGMSLITQTVSPGPGYVYPASAYRPPVTSNTVYRVSVYLAKGNSQTPSFGVLDAVLGTVASCAIDWSVAEPVLFAFSNVIDSSVVAGPHDTYKVTLVVNSGAATSLVPVVYPDRLQGIGSTIYVGYAQTDLLGGAYIRTDTAPVTVTDYAASSTGLVIMGQVPAIGASLTWTGSYTYEYREDAPTLADRTVISQYANSPTLRQLIRNMDEYINPDADFDAFYDYVWNVETAQGFGLDVWGRIVGVGRMLTIPASETFLGYQEAYTAPTAATGAQPFGQAPMYVGAASSQTYRLADDAYRKLILVKALANISDCTSPSLNRLLSNLFAGRGRCYVTDTGLMEFRYVFEFALEPYEVAIMTQSGAIPKPAAVLANVLQVDVPTTFGFNEAVMQPFGSGVFFTSSGLIHAS